MNETIPDEMWSHPVQPKSERPDYCLQSGENWPCVAPYCWCKPEKDGDE